MNRSSTAALALLALTGCIEEDRSDPALDGAREFASLLPTSADLVMAVPGDTSERRSADELDPFYVLTREASGSVNGFVENWLDTLHDIVSLTPVAEGEDAWAWGPMHQGEGGLAPTTEYLVVQREADGTFSYAVIEAARAEDDDRANYVPIIAGKLLGGTSVEDSFGWFAVDFTAAAEMDPMRDTVGHAVFAYDMVQGPLVVAALDDIATGGEPATNALYGYIRGADGSGVMDVLVHGDVGGTDMEETWDLRSRWTADGAGRSDGQITGGDLGLQVATLNDCWAMGAQTVFYANDLAPETEYGDEADCAFAEESLPGTLPTWLREVLDAR
jgi:hypothetical protein